LPGPFPLQVPPLARRPAEWIAEDRRAFDRHPLGKCPKEDGNAQRSGNAGSRSKIAGAPRDQAKVAAGKEKTEEPHRKGILTAREEKPLRRHGNIPL